MADESSLRAKLNERERRPSRDDFRGEHDKPRGYIKQGSWLLGPLWNDHNWKTPLEEQGLSWQDFNRAFSAVSDKFVAWSQAHRSWTDAIDALIAELDERT